MNTIKLIFILAFSLSTLVLLSRNYRKGLAIAVFFLVLMPRELFIPLSAGLPTLTGFRAVILVVLFYSLFTGKLNVRWQKKPILILLILVLFVKLCSLLFAHDFTVSLNGFLIFVIERLLFFYILIKGIQNREYLDSILRSIGLAIVIITLLGFIERYTQFNPVDYITPSDDPRFESRMSNEIYSTLPHPILFGAALAMGLPICLYLFDKTKNKGIKPVLGIHILLIIASIYFSNSRGPWLACVVTIIMLLFLNYPRMKIRIIPMIILAIIILLMRPGVFDTIYGLSASTFDENSLEGGSFQYRFELFRVAYHEIIQAPERVAFGFGDNAAQSLNISGTLSYGSKREYTFWSWDNEFAILLLHNGFIGFILQVVMYLYCLIYLINNIQKLTIPDKRLMISLIASNAVFIFMMTNVAIFAPQIHFIFWANMAIGLYLTREDLSPQTYHVMGEFNRFFSTNFSITTRILQ
jgi:O-antigen ligase